MSAATARIDPGGVLVAQYPKVRGVRRRWLRTGDRPAVMTAEWPTAQRQ
jgi:hypothetical protein